MYDFRDRCAADPTLLSALNALLPISQEWASMRKRFKAARVRLDKASTQYPKGSPERRACEFLRSSLTYYERGDLDDTMMRVISPQVEEALKVLNSRSEKPDDPDGAPL
jgi:hypothetical protein